MDFEPLYDDELVCIAPASYRPARPGCVSAEELRGQPFVSQLADVDADIQSYFKTNDLRVDSRCYIVDDQSMIAMVACGRGFAIMPELMFKTGTDPTAARCCGWNPLQRAALGWPAWRGGAFPGCTPVCRPRPRLRRQPAAKVSGGRGRRTCADLAMSYPSFQKYKRYIIKLQQERRSSAYAR